MRILVVEDEQKVADALREGLVDERYDVVVERTGEGAFFRVNTETFDVVLLDLTLPGRDGLEILRALRQRRMETPVLVLTARDSLEDRVTGLDAGADDYLVKPFAFAELLARIRALVRRGRVADAPKLAVGDLEMDLVTRKVLRGGKPGGPHRPRVRAARISDAVSGAGRVARDAGARCLEGNRTHDAARQRDRRPHRAPAPQGGSRTHGQVDPHYAWRRLHAARRESRDRNTRWVAGRWWRSHSVRMRLTLWDVAATTVVLGAYLFGVYTSVSRNVSDSLDERLRADFYWAAATVDEGPDGLIMPFPQIDLLLEEESPWVQVWSVDGKQLLLSNDEAQAPSHPGKPGTRPARERT